MLFNGYTVYEVSEMDLYAGIEYTYTMQADSANDALQTARKIAKDGALVGVKIADKQEMRPSKIRFMSDAEVDAFIDAIYPF